MIRNQRTYDPTASYGINRGKWHDWPDPERDDTEAEGLPLPAWADGWHIEREKPEARR